MAKIPIRDRPRSLPDARFYLDQIEAIQNVFLEYIPKTAEPKFEYDVDGTDRFSCIGELIEHGGHTGNFSLRLLTVEEGRAQTDSVFEVGRLFSKLWITVPYNLREHEWSICGKIDQIIEPRIDPWIQFASSFPNAAIYAPVILFVAMSVLTGMKFPRAATATGALATIALILVALKFYGEMLRKSRVYLRYERTKQKETANRRNELLKTVFLLTLGYALKSLFDYLTAVVTRRH